MARTRTHLPFHVHPGQKAIRSSAHKAALRPLPFPQLVHSPNIILDPQLQPGEIPLATCVPSADYSHPRESVRKLLTAILVYVSGVPGARMCWKLRLFRDQVVIRYGVILVGWPSDVPFWNFSNKGGPNVVHLRAILDRLTADPPQLYFTPATEKQLHMARLSSGGLLPSTLHPECPPLPNFGRSDIGRRHTKYDKEGSAITPRHVRDGPKSVKMIEAEPKDEVVDANTQPRATGPLPQIRNMFGHLGWYETGWRDLEQEREFAVERGL